MSDQIICCTRNAFYHSCKNIDPYCPLRRDWLKCVGGKYKWQAIKCYSTLDSSTWMLQRTQAPLGQTCQYRSIFVQSFSCKWNKFIIFDNKDLCLLVWLIWITVLQIVIHTGIFDETELMFYMVSRIGMQYCLRKWSIICQHGFKESKWPIFKVPSMEHFMQNRVSYCPFL